MDIGDRIRLRREELKLSQDELSEKLGYTGRSAISKIEKGINGISISKLPAYADALNTSVEYLTGVTDNPDPPAPMPDEAFPINPTHCVPILGTVAAGIPMYADENIEGYIWIDHNHGGEYFGLRVRGDSMNGLRIYDGDTLVVRKQEEVSEGDVAVVLVNRDSATVKKFYRSGNTITLVPVSTNPIHQPQVYDLRQTEIRIVGRVVENRIEY